MDFPTFLSKVRPAGFVPPPILLALDPGETTGYALFIHGELKEVRQLKTKTVKEFATLFQNIDRYATLDPNLPDPCSFIADGPRYSRPTMVVYEDYKVYSWKADAHAWASLHTPKAIGALQCLATLYDIPLYTQMAQQAKGFCTDVKLQEWGYYKPGLKHARDAIRHGCFYLLHNFVPDKEFGSQGLPDVAHFNGNL